MRIKLRILTGNLCPAAMAIMVTALVIGLAPSAARARDIQLATYQWREGAFTNRVTVQEPLAYERHVRLWLGLIQREDGSYYVSSRDGGMVITLIMRAGPTRPVVRSSINLDPHPWEAALAVIEHREKLFRVARMWSFGLAKEREAGTALRQLLDFNWEEKEFVVEYVYYGPRPGLEGPVEVVGENTTF